ncbi:unnamed protein product [Acanthoscelides obtectus]|uniref:Uncharacterized protein n=1 Tax=Acanthoscelides obtectus TaxID=200917 RepID=A0A9P0KH26_ACAOB|nr:unnamed protein product [Acanthoscelides obtectus]CAK1664998.1 hypothetical protein AOBTE_LOCUS24600 [Acanthoscelides obtectus]
MINVNNKAFAGKSITKIDSLDSNSSDSGGFKDFVQLDLNKPPSPEPEKPPNHRRKASQPDFFDSKLYSHQRKASQPEVRHTFKHQQLKANAQALEQFLPQKEQKLLHEEEFRQQMSKLSVNQKTEDQPRPMKKPILAQGQFQQSTKKLEELLAQRLEKEKAVKKGQSCVVDGESSGDTEQKMIVQRQIHQKLHADLQQTVKQIQEIQSIELRLPQNRKWNESSRSQPAIGLKHTPKSRVSQKTQNMLLFFRELCCLKYITFLYYFLPATLDRMILEF